MRVNEGVGADENDKMRFEGTPCYHTAAAAATIAVEGHTRKKNCESFQTCIVQTYVMENPFHELLLLINAKGEILWFLLIIQSVQFYSFIILKICIDMRRKI